MPYSSDLNTKILTFLNRAQSKIAQTAKLIANKVSEGTPYQTYKDEVETAEGLASFVESLDNVFNDWTELEISQFIDKWTAKANLNSIAYVEHDTFNTRFTVPFNEVTNLGPSQGDLDAYRLLHNNAVALVDGATITLTTRIHTLTTTQATITFADPVSEDFIDIEVTFNQTAATWTFPSGSLCVFNGTASGTNTMAVTGVSGDKIILSRALFGSAKYYIAVNFGQ